MRHVFRRLAVLLVLGFATQAAAAATPAVLTTADRADVGRIERYLTEMRTLQARFRQVADNGATAVGTFMMSRPGKMKLVYDPPIKDYVVSDGTFVFYWDADLQQQSSQPLGYSLADLFLRETVKLSSDVTITRIVRQAGALEVSIVQTDDAGKGELTLIFDDKPLQLRKWRVLDAQGLITSVALSDVHTGVSFDDGLFEFHDPNLGKPRRK